jgi:hypothetical protein
LCGVSSAPGGTLRVPRGANGGLVKSVKAGLVGPLEWRLPAEQGTRFVSSNAKPKRTIRDDDHHGVHYRCHPLLRALEHCRPANVVARASVISSAAVGLAGAGVALYGTRRTGSWRPSLQRLLPFVQSLWLSTKWAAIHVRKKGQLAAVLTTPTFENGPKLGLCWACGRGGRKVVAFDATYIWPGRIGENVRPTLGAVHGRDHDRLQSLGLTAAWVS